METFITVRKGVFKKKIGLRFDLRAWAFMGTEYGIDINNPDNNFNATDFFIKQIHSAAISYCIQYNGNVWFNLKTITKWFVVALNTDVEKVKKTIVDSVSVVKADLENLQDTEKKKKHGMK